MKSRFLFLLSILTMIFAVSCEKDPSISGEQSGLGEVGTEITGTFSGASDIKVKVTALDNGVSTVGGTFKMTDERYMRLINSHPKYFEVNGDQVTVKDLKFKFTENGIENVSGEENGVIINYHSKVGDTYSNGRKVTHVSSDNDFDWRGMRIKVIEVEQNKNKGEGVKSVKYWGNHRFGIVAVETTFDDGTVDFATVRIW